MMTPAELAAAARCLRAALQQGLADGVPGVEHLARRWMPRLVAGDPATCLDGLAQIAALAMLHDAPAGSLAAEVGDDLASTAMPPPVRSALEACGHRTSGRRARFDHDAFAEAFLAAYDGDLRRSCGAFYTPQAVVQTQVRWADRLLRDRLGIADGLGSSDVAVIDPAMGTGAYLRAVAKRSPAAGGQLIGRELMPGPFAVAELLLSGASASLELGDALARGVDTTRRLRVCLGNPPYVRHEAGGAPHAGLLRGLADVARAAGHGGDLKNLYNLYVSFWAWAVREVFEAAPDRPGLLTFITASSYLAGDAFVGLRESLRRECDAIWIVDLGGEGRGARQDANVFPIQSPVAITVAWRAGPRAADRPAVARYARLTGSRLDKLTALESFETIDELTWSAVSEDWQAPLLPTVSAAYSRWPALVDLMPWQHSGVQPKRTWPIAPDCETLQRRWTALLASTDRAAAMRASPDRTLEGQYPTDPAGGQPGATLGSLSREAAPEATVPYQFRSFDQQWLLADGRLLSRPRPSLWQVHSDRQLYFAASLSLPPGHGPALTVSRAVPDLHVYCGRGAKDILPLYRDRAGSRHNLAPGLLDFLSRLYGCPVSGCALASYLYGALAQPQYAELFYDALSSEPLRVPLTREADLFQRLSKLGGRLLEMQVAPPQDGSARCTAEVPADEAGHPAGYRFDTEEGCLYVGEGCFAPVTPEVMRFEVSGLRVVDSWLGYRLATPRGRRSSPLDDIHRAGWPPIWTRALLSLLWTLERSLALYPLLEEALGEVLAGGLVAAQDLAAVPDWCRKPPDPGDLQPSLDFD